MQNTVASSQFKTVSLDNWFARNGKNKFIIYIICGLIIQLVIYFDTVNNYNSFVNKQIKGNVKNIVTLGLQNNYRDVVEASIKVIVEDLNAHSLSICTGTQNLFSYPKKTNLCVENNHTIQWYIVDGYGYKVGILRNNSWFPKEIFYTNLMSLLFLLTGSLFLLRVQSKLLNDIIKPLLSSIFEEKVISIKEIEDIRVNFIAKKELEKDQAVYESKILVGRQVSHDIQSPIGAIKSALTVLEKKPQAAGQLLSKAIERIESIASDLSEKKAPSFNVKTDLIMTLSEIITEKEIEHPNLRIESNIKDLNSILYINGNKSDYLRVFSNILNNAIEASDANCKRVVVKIVQLKDYTEVTFQNYGTRISKENISKVFQSGVSFNKKNGSGLGLAYAKKILEENGYQVSISSSIENGTIVSLKLYNSTR